MFKRNPHHILPVAEPPQVDAAGSDRQSADPAQPDTPPSTLQTLQTRRLPQVIIQHSTSEQQTPAASSSAYVTHTNALYVTRAGQVCKPNPKYEQ